MKARTPSLERWRNVVRFLRDPLTLLTEVAARGDLVRFGFGPRDAFLVSDPRLIEEVLANESWALRRQGGYCEHHFSGESLFTQEKAPHKQLRTHVKPLFHRELVARSAALIGERAERLASEWQPGQTVQLDAAMTGLWLEIIGGTIFGAGSGPGANAIRAAYDGSREVFYRVRLPYARLLWALPLASTRRYDDARRGLDGEIAGGIEDRRRRKTEADDLLALLVSSRVGEADGLRSEQIQDEAWSYIAQGAPAWALTWSFYLLAQHPEVEQRLHQVVDDVLDDRAPTASDLPGLQYAGMVFDEAMRLYPPVWAIARAAERDFKLGDVLVPSGSMVLVSPYTVHRDERYWPEPLRFDPDRWSGKAPAERARGAFLTFGAGQRECVASDLVSTAGTLIIATLARHWRLRPVSERVQLATFPFLEPKGGLAMRLERRGTHAAARDAR